MIIYEYVYKIGFIYSCYNSLIMYIYTPEFLHPIINERFELLMENIFNSILYSVTKSIHSPVI